MLASDYAVLFKGLKPFLAHLWCRQAVLCSGRLPPACLTEVLRFVHGQPELCGNLSLQALCLGPREAAALLLDFCPQAVLRHAQVFSIFWNGIPASQQPPRAMPWPCRARGGHGDPCRPGRSRYCYHGQAHRLLSLLE